MQAHRRSAADPLDAHCHARPWLEPPLGPIPWRTPIPAGRAHRSRPPQRPGRIGIVILILIRYLNDMRKIPIFLLLFALSSRPPLAAPPTAAVTAAPKSAS